VSGRCDLEALYGTAASTLPYGEDAEPDEIALSGQTLPAPPAAMETDQLCATWGYHFYGDSPVEAVSFEVDKATARHLGLLIFARVFHRKAPRVVVELTHPRSTLRRLIIGLEDSEPGPGLEVWPHAFHYSPWTPDRHPWLSEDIQASSFPFLTLTNEAEMLCGTADLPTRDTLAGFGPDDGACRLAELFLNAGGPDHDENEFALEGECGFRGMGPGSPELKIWLPGSLGHLDSEPTYL